MDRSLLRDAGRADDVAQHAMLVAARRAPRATDLRSWLVRIVRNLIRDDVRSRKLRDHHERSAARTDPTPSTRDVLEREEQRQRVVDAVLALPQPYRGVVLMRTGTTGVRPTSPPSSASRRRRCGPS